MIEQRADHQRPFDGSEPSIESHIGQLERALGLTTRRKILLEAQLLIDRPFFDWSIVSGFPEKPERLFGDREWAGHLNARLFAKEYGKQPLTIDFIKGLHNAHLQWTHPDVAENFSDRPDPQGGIGILTAEQAEAVYFNYMLKWQSHDGNEQPKLRGGMFHFRPDTGTFIYIPNGHNVSSREIKLKILQRLCDWYNGGQEGFYSTTEGYSHDLDPYTRSGLLQHRFVSLHPLTVDYNGRVSRDLMNWSLENDGYAPSALHTFDDHTFRENKWIKEVERGSIDYDISRKVLEREPSIAIPRLFGILSDVPILYKNNLKRYLDSHPGLQDELPWPDVIRR